MIHAHIPITHMYIWDDAFLPDSNNWNVNRKPQNFEADVQEY